MENKWIFYKEIDFSDQSIMQYHIDTRDFHCLAKTEPSGKMPDMDKISKYPERFFHSSQEVVAMLDRYFKESGGEREWRFFSLKSTGDWFKYIRIYRNGEHLIVCDRYSNRAYTKEVLNSEVSVDE